MRTLAPLLMLLAGASVAPQDRVPAAGPVGRDFIVYEADAGDTLEDLARDHFLHAEDWRLARAENRLASTLLADGQKIRLETSWLRHVPLEAEILGFRGDVRVTRGATELRVVTGLKLREGDRLDLGPMGFLTIGLPDGSEAAIPTNSAVVIERLRRYSLANGLDRRFRVERGGLESRVTPMRNPSSRYEVTTPISVAAVRGTDFRVSFTPGSDRSLTEVLEGKVGVQARSGPETGVPADYGLVVTVAGAGAIERLLAPPVALDVAAVQAGTEVRLGFRREPGAVAWRAEFASDEGFRQRLLSMTSADGQFRVAGLASGTYFVRVMAISASGLTGRPATFRFDRRRPGTAADSAPGGNDSNGVLALSSSPSGASDSSGGDSGGGLPGLAGVAMAAVGPLGEAGGEVFEEGDTSEGVEAFVGTSSPAAGPWSALGRFIAPSGVGGGGPAGGGAGSTGGEGEPGSSSESGGSGSGSSGSGSSGSGSSGGGGSVGGGDGVGAPTTPVNPPAPAGGGGNGTAPVVGAPTSGLPFGVPPSGLEEAPEAVETSSGTDVVALPEPVLPAVPGESLPIIPPAVPGSAGPGPGLPAAGPVPEAGTWAMLIGGFGLVGFALRRRRRLTAAT